MSSIGSHQISDQAAKAGISAVGIVVALIIIGVVMLLLSIFSGLTASSDDSSDGLTGSSNNITGSSDNSSDDVTGSSNNFTGSSGGDDDSCNPNQNNNKS